VKYTPAFHSSGIVLGDGVIRYGGQPGGILLTMNGQTLFHAGDTALFSDMKLIGERNTIDIAALPIGDVLTMGPEDALLAAEWLGARHYIPVHFNTFPAIAQDADLWCRLLKDKDLDGVHLRPSESFEL
jgi:L-ascorbate metabolism protein UlaG (beta-lactamase superfamily)